MSFFDDKQEVLKIELTEYGKHLLSKGKFAPQYYAFYDDDILYDSRYANISESQNSSQERILNNTPSNKPQGFFSTVENLIKEQNDQKIKNNFIHSFANRETNMSNVFPLGTSQVDSSYYPAWNISVLSGAIDNVKLFEGNIENGTKINIPQINMKSNYYRIFITEEPVGTLFKSFIDDNDKQFFLEADPESLYYYFNIEEKNSQNLNHDFEIEIFEEQEKTMFAGTADEKKYKIWNQLYFDKKPTNIKNNILLDDYLNSENFNQFPIPINAEWFFDIFVDDEMLPASVRLKKDGVVYGVAGAVDSVAGVTTEDTKEDCEP